ncbi:MAG: hemerythrin domain-containing protein [Lysobacteraceae bacterium]|nr:MAG: hemerythrin domain-containing protein [Xanthomonadaceae bacterium]
MARDILKTLKSEHNELRTLFKQMEDTTDRAKKSRADLLADIEAGLLPHAKWEELVFYPAFKARADREGLKTHAEAVQEHRAVELTVLPDLKTKQTDTVEFAGSAKVLGEFVDHHAKEEEDTMFKMARKLFSAEELAEFDEQYEQWKQSAEARAEVAAAQKQPSPQPMAA